MDEKKKQHFTKLDVAITFIQIIGLLGIMAWALTLEKGAIPL